MESDDTLERKALRNTRALVDMLEVDERTRARRQRRALALLAVAAAIPVALAVAWAVKRPNETAADKRMRDCKVEAWSAKSSEVTERIRAANPGMPYTEIAKQLKQAQDTFMETAKVACEGAPAGPGR